MGMIVSVYRDAEITDDCTNNGISARFVRLCVINVEGPFEPDETMPTVRLETNAYNTLRIVPVECAGKLLQFGGNYAATSDSRFSRKCEELLGHRFYGAVPIHDRIGG